MAVITIQHGDVVEVCLDWQESRNALGPAEGRELRLALLAATSKSNAAAILLSAKGKAFCAGGNLSEILRLAKQGAESVRTAIYGEFQGIFRAINASPVPVISAVDGPAIGFGCDLALAGKVTWIGSKGWLAQGWSKAGLIPATGGTFYVMRRAGPQAVWRFLASDRVDGATAQEWGLGIACEDARAAALAMAQQLALLPREPLKAVKKLAEESELEKHLQMALQYQTGFITGPEFQVLATQLLAKRG